MINIMLVDDHPVIRRGLRALLEAEPGFKVVGDAGDGFEAVQVFEKSNPNVVLLDMVMKGASGIEVSRQLTKNNHSVGVIIYSMLSSKHHVLEALRAGARGYVLKESPSEELVQAIRAVAAGHKYLSTMLLDRTIDIFMQIADGNGLEPLNTLTPREKEVLELSAQGNTAAEIAKQLYVSRRTVEAQRASVMRKLGLKNQHELIVFASQKGILESGLSV